VSHESAIKKLRKNNHVMTAENLIVLQINF